jgi:hypothetical protein
VSDGPSPPNLNGTPPTVAARRKAAKRTLPWDLAAGELDLVPPQPQAQDIPARKKARLEDPFSITTDEVARKTASTDVSVGLPPPVADNDDDDDDDVIAVPVTDTQANAMATGRWTIDEDAQLTDAVANTSKKKYGKEHKTDWVAISVPVPGRTRMQCHNRWQNALDPRIGRTPPGNTGRWTEDEDIKLKDSVKRHGDKDWVTVAALVPGRTKKQGWKRWFDALNPIINGTTRHMGKWVEDEDSKLKDAVQTHGGKNWIKLQRWFRVERKYSVLTDGRKYWIPASPRRLDVRVNGQKSKIPS